MSNLFKSWRARLRTIAKRKGRHASALQLIQESGLHDPDWYLSTYSDVARSDSDSLEHYFYHGWREGRDPGPGFRTSAYLAANLDVARSGANPLLHFIEFGRTEGRESFGRHEARPPTLSGSFDLPDPNPVASFPLGKQKYDPWRQSYRLEDDRNCAVGIPGQIIGYASGLDQETAVRADFAALSALSGFSDNVEIDLPAASELSVDAWFATSTQLRTRWNANRWPLVVRAYQHDARADDGPSLVGEARVSSSLDLIDCQLHNPYFPVLFVFSDPTGSIRGTQMLAFPSLCRGGVHYPELVASGRFSGRPLNPFKLGSEFARAMIGQPLMLVSKISIDVRGGDGTGPMFQPDFQSWLSRVVRVTVQPEPNGDGSMAGEYLEDAARVDPLGSAREGGATLRLRSDTIPTIGILTVPGNSRNGVTAFLPVLRHDPEKASALHLFACNASALEEDGDTHWPILTRIDVSGLQREVAAGAIQAAPFKPLSVAEQIDPSGSVAPENNERDPISWLVETAGWDDDHLVQAIESISTQAGSSRDWLILLGPGHARAVAVAETLFTDRIQTYADAKAAIENLKTDLVAVTGLEIILHDHQVASLLARLLKDSKVATASCPLISLRRFGRNWHASIEDHGRLELLWRNCFPVSSPVGGLWIARSSLVRRWASGEATLSDGSIHLCSTQRTVSYVGRHWRGMSGAIQVPEAPVGRTLTMEELAG